MASPWRGQKRPWPKHGQTSPRQIKPLIRTALAQLSPCRVRAQPMVNVRASPLPATPTSISAHVNPGPWPAHGLASNVQGHNTTSTAMASPAQSMAKRARRQTSPWPAKPMDSPTYIQPRPLPHSPWPAHPMARSVHGQLSSFPFQNMASP
jgi:hypothetical protein